MSPSHDVTRPAYYNHDGTFPSQAWIDRYGFIVHSPDGRRITHHYVPTPRQLDFHESQKPNAIIEGARGTGKSLCLRNDAHMRALQYPGYSYLIVRRTMPELRKSHLRFIMAEMRAFGGSYHKTDAIATYPNGSQGFFGHCETEADMLKLLSSQYDAIYFDEISTFTWVMVTKIASCTRVEFESGKLSVVRGGTNPIGEGAAEIRRYYVAKDITPEEDPDYNPAEYEAIHTTLDDNPHIDREQYVRRLSSLPEHVKRAWLHGEWIAEDTYFHDFRPRYLDKPWHVVDVYPVIRSRRGEETPPHTTPWIQIYRCVDWGFSPDPAVCLWVAVLPNGRAFVLKEQHWRNTPAREVARAIVVASEGMRIVDTYCDPTMFAGSGATDTMSIGDIFEANGVPLTPSLNDRAAAGFAIHEYLSTVLGDDLPKLQIYGPGCPMLVRTIPEMRIDKNDPRKLAARQQHDHWVIALAYFCLGAVGLSRESIASAIPRWMKPNPRLRGAVHRIGSESVRRRVSHGALVHGS